METPMADRLLVGTRKGLFILERSGGTARKRPAARQAAVKKPCWPLGGGWRVVRTAFLGEPVSMGLADRRDGTLYAALNLGHLGSKLRRSTDGGDSWQTVTTELPPIYFVGNGA